MPEIEVNGTSAQIVREIAAMRTEFSKTYLMSDDTYTTASYANSIHCLDENGEWQDIDNTLMDSGDKYVNENSNVETEVSKKLSEGGTLSVNANGYEISWGYVGAAAADAVVDNDTDDADESDTAEEDSLALDNLVSRTLYSEIYSGVDAEYIINPNGVKENIILKNRSAQNEFLIKYNFDNLLVRLENSRTVQLLDVNGDLVYTLCAPVMTDNDGNCSESLAFSIAQQSASSLTLKLTAINGTVVVWNSAQTQVLHRYSADDKAFCEEINGTEYKTEFSSAEKTVDAPASTLGGNLFAYCGNNPNMNFDYCGYAKMNIKWLGTAIDLILWLIPALYAFSKICKEVSKSASKLVSFGNKLISAGKKLFKRFDNRLYCAFAKDSTYRMVKTIGVLARIVSIISSPGNIVQYIIDILDGKWDGYLDTKRFGPKLDLTRDY